MSRITPAWLHSAETRRVMEALGQIHPLFVGGCVRDALLGRESLDIDIAVAAPPEESFRLAESAGLGAYPTGMDHGVITVTASGRPFEVASLRRDVETDGRRAVVAFTDDIGEDAARRDFTMNALYARADGEVLDPLGTGLADLAARRVVFVGEAGMRIAEDYLRILRFFRFHATLGIEVFDPVGAAACIEAAEGLAHVSKERIGAEMMKLLGAPDPEPALVAMGRVLGICLPGAVALEGLVERERGQDEPPSALRRLAAVQAENPAEALRLSRREADYLKSVAACLNDASPLAARAYRHGAEAARDAALIAGEPASGWRDEIMRGAEASPPVSAADLMERGVAPGPALGKRLRELEERWIASDFQAGKAELLGEE